ncbi:hypothetical protein P153DRAFT_381171 [Dothidotthia symphoricarpi CBS 119687]|uniref:Uncharacterized protein n=1 Tax=Dothidotthia symphoricarpi CBS 119687 TaxID=1392245 RepID=A0A6A6AQ00_9PLEO|nr:uncharacterized protein P153DRAFT_381171 [Dothidotthia symphoricarpi CBS 119687]KAF2133999.1 hypothetical protein P153DRAFT_381171 [Dothidotthia symphoricarpi CBS 119687]
MASGSKRQRGSGSPHRESHVKRTRRLSSSASVHSQRKSASQQPPRAKSVFRGDRDPYLPKGNSSATFLPTSDDWTFRVKVISSSTDLDNDVFKRAVQGLVKICFPEKVLEELGIQVLEDNMRHEKAPEANITKMVEIFRSEMVHRVVWMLAEYLDTSSKVDATVSSIMAASAKLHGENVGDDVLGYVIDSLNRLRSRVPCNSTELLANGEGLKESTEDKNAILDSEASTAVEDDAAKSSDESSEEEPAPPRKKGKRRKKDKSRKRLQEQDHAAQGTETEMDTPVAPAESVVQSQEEQPPDDKEKKVSSTWRWDIDPENLSRDAILDVFKRTTDLFAFHALPIAQRQFGLDPTPKRKELRKKIQSMFDDMEDKDHAKWDDSLRKLRSGDVTMLVRTETPSSYRHRNTATPAPITRVAAGRSSTANKPQDIVGLPDSDEILIKREATANDEVVVEASGTEARSHEGRFTATATTFQQLSTKERVALAGKNGSHDAGGHDLATEAKAPQKRPQTPIVDFLIGHSQINLQDFKDSVYMIMERLFERISDKSINSINVVQHDGTIKTITRFSLQVRLMACIPNPKSKWFPEQSRMMLEENLIPWVLANFFNFVELKQHEFFFTHIKPILSTVVDSVCDRRMSLDKESSSITRATMTLSLHQRGLSMRTICGRKNTVFQDYLNGIVGDHNCDNNTRRHRLDRVLRSVAFIHREKFPELKSSALVKEWERLTGLKW